MCMKIINAELACKLTLACVFFLLIAAFPGNAAEIDDSLAKCAAIKDDHAKRLQCFDDLAKQQTAAKEAAIAIPAEKSTPKEPAAEKNVISVMEKYWDMSLDPNKERNIFVLWLYRPCFFLPLAYNSSPNEDTNLDFDPKAKSQYNEVKFQLSFKFKI